MSRIVHPHFPVERLPAEFRDMLGNSTHVRLTIEDTADDEAMLRELDAMLDEAKRDIDAGNGVTLDEVRAMIGEEFARAQRKAS